MQQQFTVRDDLPRIVGSEVMLSPTCGETGLGCDEHGEPLKVFCETDQRAICLECVCSVHRTHTATPIREAVALYKGKLQEAMEKISRHADEVLETRRAEESSVADVKRGMIALQKNMAHEFGKLHLFLSEEEEALAQRLKEREADLLLKLEQNIKKASREITLSEQLIRNIQQRLGLQDGDLLKNVKLVLESLGQTCDKFQVPLRVPVDVGLGEMNGPLQYAVWKRMLQVIAPGACVSLGVC
uniref:Zinc-binding protein A33-like n=1 Tax=Callorhinchus milii TaxID=7868 RepID=A0A4W3HPL3_CALMI